MRYAKQKNKIVNFKKSSKQYSRGKKAIVAKSAVNAKADGFIVLFFAHWCLSLLTGTTCKFFRNDMTLFTEKGVNFNRYTQLGMIQAVFND